MSGYDVSTAETVQSDQYRPVTPQQQHRQQQHHVHYYKTPTKQQQHLQTAPPRTPSQLRRQQQQQQLEEQELQTFPLHNTPQISNNLWVPQKHDPYLQQHLQQHHHLDSKFNNNSINTYNGVPGICGKIYITPSDIPPPPPQPQHKTNLVGGLSTTSRYLPDGSLMPTNPPTQHRCKCDHPIELLGGITTPSAAKTAAAAASSALEMTTTFQYGNQQQHQHHQHLASKQQLQQQTLKSHNYGQSRAEHLTPPPPPLPLTPTAREHLMHSHQQKNQHQHQHQHQHLHQFQTSQQQKHHHHLHQHQHKHQHQHLHHHRNPNHLLQQAKQEASARTNRNRIKNLVYSQNKIRRIRIILGTITGLVILGLLATAVYFIIAGGDTDIDDTPKVENGLTLDDVLSGQLNAKRFNGTWSSGSKLLYRENHTLYEYDTKTQARNVLLRDVGKYFSSEKSADGQYLLLGTNLKKNFRHSFEAEYDVLNMITGEIKPLYINSEQRFILMIQWAPVGNGIIMNFERNLYYKPNVLGDKIVQLTYDDNPKILNGIPDWVYEEEVLASNIATWFNPSGTKIAYIRFDDSPTPLINFPFYGEAGDLRYQYPYNRVVAYPKAGSSNPSVTLYIVDLKQAVDAGDNFITEVPPPSALNTEADRLITVVSWLNDTHVLSGWMNRIQNEAYLQIMNELKRVEIYSNSSKTGWVDLYDVPYKNRDGSKIALILPTTQDDGTDYRHLCLLSTTTSNNKPEALTKGKYVVQSVLHWDSSTDIIFYTANTQEHSEFTHIYAIKAVKGQTPKCLTCKLQYSGGKEQTYYSAEFNTDRQVAITSQGPGIPVTKIYEWTVANNQVTLKELVAWETNDQLSNTLSKTALPTTEILELPIANNAFKAKVLLQLPPNIDRSGKTKYPMLVDVYGGPDSFSVITKWSMDWGTYLSSNQSVIYAKIDGRGSGLRGEKILHSIYQKLGTLEIQDQIDVARQLQQKFAFINENHTGIWGWSYGGYAAAMALANDDNFVYRCAASIAPVTDWALYDSIYTERYMGLPNINVNGYDQGRLSTRAKKLRGKKFLLVHGTLDDNVHYQQAMILAKNLEREDILFKQISYPDEDHGLANVRPHLYHSLNRFFGDCFASKSLMHSFK